MYITGESFVNPRPFRAMFTVAQGMVDSSRHVLSFPFFQSTIISCCHEVLTVIADNKTRAKETKVKIIPFAG